MKKKKPVLQDVANRIGVTRMTVSRLLHNPEQVSVVLYDKVATALDELDYIPNRTPDVFSNATSRAIGVLLPSLTNQVSAEVLRRIESVTDTHGHQTMLAHYGYKPEMEQERLESMLLWGIDGLILTKRIHTPCILKMIEVAGISVVELTDSKSPCPDIAVDFDNLEAAHQVTTAIIARGRRHIAYPGVRLDERTIIKQGRYKQAMLDVDLVPYSVMVEQFSSYPSGIELIRQAQREYPQLDDMFCTNDNLAVGAAFECRRSGLKIPDGMAIASFHGYDVDQMMEPRLASVLTPRKQMGSIGAEYLLARICGESVIPKMLGLGFTLSPGRPV